MDPPEPRLTCETRLPRRSGLACGARSPLQALTVPHLVSHACHCQCKALAPCHVNRRLIEPPESQPTCETRLPRSPGLACGAARPCKHSQCLTLCHMPPPSLHKALIARHACMHPYDKLESKPTCETGLPRSPGLARGARSPLQAVTVSHLVSDACPSQCKALIICHNIYISVERKNLNPPVRPVCPEAPVWPVEPLAPAGSHSVSPCVRCLSFSMQSSDNLPCQ